MVRYRDTLLESFGDHVGWFHNQCKQLVSHFCHFSLLLFSILRKLYPSLEQNQDEFCGISLALFYLRVKNGIIVTQVGHR